MAEKNKSNEVNKKAKAHAAAAWEWFKSAAWLQVLLIVGVVVAIVVSTPYIVSACRRAQNNDDSSFYKGHRISYKEFQSYLTNPASRTNGVVGNGEYTGESFSDDKDGFVVMFYKDNDSDSAAMEKYVEDAYDYINKSSEVKSRGSLKFYAVNVSWYPDDKEKSDAKEKLNDYQNNYSNKYISLQQQMDVTMSIKNTYLAQEEDHRDDSAMDKDYFDNLDLLTNGGTMKTPLFCLYTKAKTATTYIDDSTAYTTPDGSKLAAPTKVIYHTLSGLSTSSGADVQTLIYDLYNFRIHHKA